MQADRPAKCLEDPGISSLFVLEGKQDLLRTVRLGCVPEADGVHVLGGHPSENHSVVQEDENNEEMIDQKWGQQWVLCPLIFIQNIIISYYNFMQKCKSHITLKSF